jgi:hypothetical protein
MTAVGTQGPDSEPSNLSEIRTLRGVNGRSVLEADVPICHLIELTIREAETEPMPNPGWVGLLARLE